MKNRILFAVFLLLTHLGIWGQIGGDFNPTNPSDPGTPIQKYTLTLNATPSGGGSFNTTSTKVAVGENYNLRAWPNSDYNFVAWVCNGDTISKLASYNYVMPAHNVDITGVFVYNPQSPSDPDEQPLKYQLSLTASPMNSGSFNFSNERLAAGSVNSLYAYTNTDYVFKQWMIGDSVLSTSRSLEFVMPTHNVHIVGQFEYNPASPENPNKNYWNKETGEVIVDDFTPNDLYSAISNAIGSSSNSDVNMIIVAGKLGDYDFGIADNFSNCSLLDLSRTTGVTEIPSYAFDYTNLESVYLPATVEKIGYRAFADCPQLLSLTVYAMTPPALDSYVFDGVQEGLVVYVPAAAIPQYQEAEGWKDFTLLPIQEDIRNLTVNLPAGINVAAYAQMWLELTNTKNGQRIHYVMTDKTAYTFMNIIRNTSWNVTLCNQSGDVFGRIDNVEVKDEDITVTFASLTQPKSVNLSVKTPDGQDVTQQTQITWTDADGKYISQGNSLTGLPVGYQTKYKVSLPEQLAMLYNIPAEADYTLTATDNNPVCQLTAIGQVKVSGKVIDKKTNQPISGAVISASQTFGGKYSKTFSCKTDNKGEYSIDLYKVPSSIAFSASDYVSQTLVCDSVVDASSTLAMQEVALKEIAGAVISLNLTYTPCTEDGETVETQNWFSDYNNVGYTLYNKTNSRAISQFNVQYPQIVLLEEVADGDELLITATSKTGAFMPVQENIVITDQAAEATIGILELGKINASFNKNINSSVKGILYDGNGKLVKSYDYAQASLSICNLTDGSYTLVSMGDSKLFSSIYDLVQFSQAGLAEGTDYVKNTVTVQSGRVSKISIEEVPTFNESKLYYTGENTSFTVNKSSVVAGNYLTLSGHIDFKPAYMSAVSNIQMVVDLPENSSFVENSVMVGNSTSNYTLNGNRLTIPIARLNDRVRFCVIPTLGGEYAPSAFAQFDINGETITQPIGSAVSEIKDIEINVPNIIASPTFTVSGKAKAKSSVNIYSGNILIGKTIANSAGQWYASCTLESPRNAEMYNVEAQISNTSGLVLHSESKSVTYDSEAVQPTEVTMTFLNGWNHKQYTVIWNLSEATCSASSYDFYTTTDFTFMVKFNTENPEDVKNIVLNVFTNANTVEKLVPVFDSNARCWIVKQQFGSSLPINVSVDFEKASPIKIDSKFLTDNLNPSQQISSEYLEDYENLNELCESFIANDDDSILDEIIAAIGFTPKSDVTDISEETIKQHLSSIPDNQSVYLDELLNASPFASTISEYMEGLEVKSCEDLTPESLLDSGFGEVLKSDGNKAYYLSTESQWQFVDFESNICYSIDLTTNSPLARAMRAAGDNGEEWISRLEELSNQVSNLVSGINGFLEQCSASLDKALKAAESDLEELYLERRWLKQNSNNAFMKGEIKFKIAAQTKVVDGIKKTSKWLKTNFSQYMSSSGKIVGKTFAFSALVMDGISAVQEVRELVELKNSLISPCKNADAANQKLVNSAKRWIASVGAYYVGKLTCDILEIGGVTTGLAALVPSGGTSVSAILAAIGVMAANIAADYAYTKIVEGYKDRTKVSHAKLIKLCKNPNQKPEDFPNDPEDENTPIPSDNGFTNPDHYQNPANPLTQPVTPIHDPSGYVYEAVATNRLEGVTATCFYKETVEDMYGDLHENIVKWDAAEYAQENPLFTDENGMYAWDVPQGLWQVKFEKEGYETTYSEWLPVPPPQLDVNIAMKQNVQPVVKNARAFEDAVEVEFDKYMMPELLNTDNILVMADGKALEGKVELLNEEVSYEGNTDTYASKIRFNAVNPFPAKDVTLLVKNQVKSYAGIRMQEDYQQDFTVEQEVRKIACDSLTTVIYGEAAEVTVSVLPAAASAGKTLNVKALSNIIISVDEQQLTLDEDGKASFLVKGELPGTSALTFSVDGYDISATTIVNVETESSVVTATPKASIASGSEVSKGTEVYLTCATDDATIYYTLDGSCPCDETGSRKVYDGTPIIINKDMTVKAMAIAKGKTESDVAEFVYTVAVNDGIDDVTLNTMIDIFPLPVREKLNVTAGGKVIKKVIISSLRGNIVASSSKAATKVTLDVGRIPTGIYIITVTTEDGIHHRKIQKTR